MFPDAQRSAESHVALPCTEPPGVPVLAVSLSGTLASCLESVTGRSISVCTRIIASTGDRHSNESQRKDMSPGRGSDPRIIRRDGMRIVAGPMEGIAHGGKKLMVNVRQARDGRTGDTPLYVPLFGMTLLPGRALRIKSMETSLDQLRGARRPPHWQLRDRSLGLWQAG